MGAASLVIGVIAIIASFFPLCGTWALLPAIVGLVLGIVEVVNKSKKGEPKGMGIAGIVLNPLAIIIIILWWVVVGAAATQGVQQSLQLQNQLPQGITFPTPNNVPTVPIHPGGGQPVQPGPQPVPMQPMKPVPPPQVPQPAQPSQPAP